MTRSTEFSCGLTSKGYKKLRKAFDWGKEKRRDDIYFEFYLDGDFHLRHLPIKFRLKEKEDENFEIQISKPVHKSFLCSNAVTIFTNITDSFDTKLSLETGKEVKGLSNKIMKKIEREKGSYKSLSKELEHLLKRIKPKGLNHISAFMGGDYLLVPAYKNTKRRICEKDSLHSGTQLEFMLEQKSAFDELGNKIKLFGLEVEPEVKVTKDKAAEIANLIHFWCLDWNIDFRDMLNVKPDPFVESINLLKDLQSMEEEVFSSR